MRRWFVAVVASMACTSSVQIDERCAGGDARACLESGRTYERRVGGQSMRARALRHYEQGCQGGLAEACLAAASMHRSGRFQDPEAAQSVERRACELGDGRGCIAVAEEAIARGDVEAALGAAKQSCAQGGAPCTRAVKLFLVRRPDQARALARAGCRAGPPSECMRLALPDLDPATRIEIYEAGCKGEHWISCVAQADAIEDHDPVRALELYRQACRHDLAVACVIVGKRRAAGGTRTDDLLQRWERDCDAGLWASCERAGRAYLERDERDATRARKLLERACTHGVASACADRSDDW